MDTPLPPGPLTVHVQRICSEYLEMPGMRLTSDQVRRLLGLDAATCTQALEFLVDEGFLSRTERGQYARVSDGASAAPSFRMAKAQLNQAVTTHKAS